MNRNFFECILNDDENVNNLKEKIVVNSDLKNREDCLNELMELVALESYSIGWEDGYGSLKIEK
jgi:hypothetical protein